MMKKILITTLLASGLNAGLNIHDFKANFIQTVKTPKNKITKYYGDINLKDNIFKWKYKKPQKKEVCMDSKMILVVDHDLEQVSIYRIGRKFDMLKILQSAKPYKKNVYTTKVDGTTYTIQMHNNKLKYIIFIDDNDNTVTINFRNLREKNVRKEICNYPASYDVIDD